MQQVVLFMVQNKKLGMVEACEFLRPFLNFMIIRMSYSTSFFRTLFSSMASVCCLYPVEAMPVIKLLLRCLRYFPCKNSEVSTLPGQSILRVVYICFYKCFTGITKQEK